MKDLFEVTKFSNVYSRDPIGPLEFENWNMFREYLRDMSIELREGKSDSELISPAVYMKGETRSNKNVVRWGKWAAVDVDSPGHDVLKIQKTFEGKLNTIIYSTASSTIKHPKFRIVFALDRALPSEEITPFWYALNKAMGFMGDRQTKDKSRMYYEPHMYRGSNHFFLCTEGSAINTSELMKKYEYVEKSGDSFMDSLPEGMREQVLNYKKSKLNNTSITWSSYRDCPFFPRSLAAKYKSLNSGWYHTMYNIMVAVSCEALKRGYPITADQVAGICREFDRETGNWYEKRPMKLEAQSALNYALRVVSID